MKNLFLILSLLSITLKSQNSEMGPEIKYEGDKLFDKIVGEDKSSFYCLRFGVEGKNKNYFFTSYNKASLERTGAVPLGQYYSELDRTFRLIRPGSSTKVMLNSFIKNAKYYIFSQVFYEDKKTLQLVLNVYSTANGQQLITEKVFGEVNCDVAGMYEEKYTIIPNYDTTKVLMVLRNINGEKQQASCVLMKLDNLLNVWEKKLMSTGPDGIIISATYQVDSDDNLYYFFKSNVDFKKRTFSGAGIATIKKDESIEKIMYSKLPTNVNLDNPSITFIKEDNAIYGFYNMRFEKQAGLFYLKFSTKTGNIDFVNEYYYPSEIVDKIFCPGSNDIEGRNNFSPAVIKKIHGTYFVYNHPETYYSFDSRRMLMSESVSICKLDAAGEINWQKTLPHSAFFLLANNQSHNNVSEINTFETDSKLSFLYLDHSRNEETTKDLTNYSCKLKEVNNTPENAYVVRISVDSDGNLNRKYMYLNNDILMIPGMPIKNSDGVLILRCQNGKKEFFKVIK